MRVWSCEWVWGALLEVVVVVVDGWLACGRVFNGVCIWKTIMRGWCVMDRSCCWGKEEVWRVLSSLQTTFLPSVRG